MSAYLLLDCAELVLVLNWLKRTPSVAVVVVAIGGTGLKFEVVLVAR